MAAHLRMSAVLLAAALLSWPSLAPAQLARLNPRSYVSPFGSRYDAFRLVCGDESLLNLPLGTVENFQSDGVPARWVVIALRDSQTLRTVIPDPKSFIAAGGSLLLADDRDLDYLVSTGIGIRSGPVEVPSGPDAYQEVVTCPIVRKLGENSPLFGGVAEIVFNHAGYLTGESATSNARAWFPDSAKVGDLVIGDAPAVAALEIGDGRLVVFADHSVFTNEMIEEGDNLRVALNSVHWLLGGRSRESVRVLFLEDGSSIETWVDPRFEEGDWPLFDNEMLLALMNEMATELEKEDVFNKLIRSGQESIRPIPLRRVVLLLCTLLFAVALCRWLLRSRFQPTETRLRATDGSRGTFFDQRQQQLLATKSFREPAQQLCRQFFREALGPVDWSTDQFKVDQDAPFWNRWQTRRQLQRLWAIADGSVTHRISHARFLAIAREITTLQDELQLRTIRLAKSSKGAV